MTPITGKGRWKEWINSLHAGILYADEVTDDHGNIMFEIFTTEKGGQPIQRIPPPEFRRRFEYVESVNDGSNALSQSKRAKRR